MSKRKRNDLTLVDKYEVIKLLDQKLSQTEISKKLGCSQSQISRISSKKEEIRDQYFSNTNPERKRQRSGKSADVEAALTTWFTIARSRDIPISGPILEQKAKDLATELGETDFNPTSGWLSRWKSCNMIVHKKLHGEKKDSDEKAADNWLENVLPNLLHNYHPNDVFNADETGLYYRALPDGTLTHKDDSVSGSKKLQERVTAMVACNMTGTDKRKLLIIGKSKDPRCFRGKKSLPVMYKNNKNAWMTAEIFKDWLREFNKDMRRQNRKVLLLVDNCSAHPQDAADRLDFVQLDFLPPNTTAIIQPCDQGIIRNLKGHYRSQLVQKVVTHIDSTTAKASQIAKSITLLDAVHMVTLAWKMVKTTTVINCFAKAGFKKDLSATDQVLINAVTDVERPPTMTEEEFNNYVDHDNDTECFGELTEADIAAAILQDEPGRNADPADDSDSDNDSEDLTLPVTLSEANNYLAALRRAMEEHTCSDFTTFYKLETEILKMFAQSRRQCKITEFVNWIP